MPRVSICVAAFVVAATVAATLQDDDTTSTPVELLDKHRGTSFIQSAGSMAPMLGLGGGPTLNSPSDGFLDEFATMEDEFDYEAVQPQAVKDTKYASKDARKPVVVPQPRILCDPFLLLETLLVIGIFAVAGRAIRWVCRPAHKSHEGETRFDPGLGKLVTFDEMVRLSAAKGRPTGASYWDSLQVQAAAEVKNSVEKDAREKIATSGEHESFVELAQAIRAGDEARCVQLLEDGGSAATLVEDACGCTALHIAAHIGSAPMARLLLDYGTKVDAREVWEETPLHIAARRGNVEVSEVLLARGANINAVDYQDRTPLVSAGNSQQEAVCELLLSKGAGVGGMADSELPPLLNALLIRRMFSAQQDQASNA